MRALKLTLMVLAGLLLLVLLAVALVVGTQTGTRVALLGLEPLLPDGIDIGSSQGRLADRLVLHDVAVRTDALVLTIARVTLRWEPMQLLRGHVEIHQLLADGVRYQALPAEAEPEVDEPLRLPQQIELPVSVAVQRLLVRDVQLFALPDQQQPLVLAEVRLAGRFEDSQLQLTTLAAQGPGVDLQGQVALTAAGEYPLGARLSWRVELPDYAPLVGETELGGSLEALQLRQELAAPYHLSFSGTVNDLLTEGVTPVIAASLSVAELQLAAVAEELPEAVLNLRARLAGPIDGLEVEAEMSGTDPQQRRFEAVVGALLSPREVLLRRLEITQPGRPGQLEGEGRVVFADQLSGDLEVVWHALQWPLTGEPTVFSPHGRLRFVGPPDDYTLALDARLEPRDQPPLELQLQGEGGRDTLAVRLEAEVASGRLGGQATLTWAPDVTMFARLNGSGLDPAVLAEDWPGSIDLAVAVAVDLDDQALTVRVDGLEASGRLRGEPLSLAADGRYSRVGAEHTALIEHLAVALGTTEVDVSGRIGELWELRWGLTSDDLSELLPEAGGRLRASGSVVGRYPQLRVETRLQGRRLAFADNRVSELDLRADLDLAGDGASAIEIAATDGSVGGLELRRLTLDAAGTPADHQLRLTLDAVEADAAVTATGSFEEPWDETQHWRFILSEARVRYRDLAPWHLVDSAAGAVSPQRVRIDRHCWQSADADLCLAAQTGADGVTASAELRELALDYFATLGPEDLQLVGAVGATLEFALAPDGVVTGELHVTTSPGNLALPPLADDDLVDADLRPRLRFEPSQASVILQPDQARIAAAVNLQYGTIRLDLMTPAAVVVGGDESAVPLGEQELRGTLEVDVPDLAFLPELLPAVARTEGSITGRLALDGTLQDPIVSGTVALRDGAGTLPVAGVRITEFAATFEGRGPEGIGVEAVAESGGGSLTVSGMLQLLGEPSAQLAIQGSEFEIMNTDDARIFASPDLTVQANEQRIAVSGVVVVPRARITPDRRAPGAVTVSPDQVLVDEAVAEPDPPRDLYAEIRLLPGDAVYFSGFGLDARIEGDVVVRESPATPITTATGELRIIDGEYRAYGQGLVIERGRIFFAGGPVTEPAVDIEAVRRPRADILVGARVRGTLDAPDFSLFSEPPMTEQEQLAYLVLGRPLDEAPGGEGSALAQAALALGLRGGDALAQNIGERLGVDELTIVTGPDEAGAESDPGQASLVVGTYLSPRLYVSYGIGLFEPGSVLQLQYEISRRWQLVTRSGGEASGVDLMFTLVRGGD